MNISSVGFSLNKSYTVNKNTLEAPLQQENSNNLTFPAEITGRSLINFKGLQLNKLDKTFVNMISKEFQFNHECTQKLNKIVSDYLKEGHWKSLSDIGGEEFIDEQSFLAEKIQEVFNFDDEKFEYLSNEIINRCDSKENYIPKGMEDSLREIRFFESMLVNTLSSKNEDNKFCDKLAKGLRLTDDESKIFNQTVLDFLNDNKMSNLKELMKDDDVNDIAALVQIISDNLDLSEHRSGMLTWEIIDYVHSRPHEYKMTMSPLDNDYDAFTAICNKNGLVDDAENYKMFQDLIDIALNNDLTNVFEVLSDKKAYSELQQKPFFHNLPSDFMIDMGVCQKNFDSLNLKIVPNKFSDNFYGSIRDKMIFDKLQQDFGFSDYTQDSIMEEITKRHPEHIDGGMEKDINQIAFELADKYNLSSGSEAKIVQMIQSIDNLNIKDLDKFIMNMLRNDVS